MAPCRLNIQGFRPFERVNMYILIALLTALMSGFRRRYNIRLFYLIRGIHLGENISNLNIQRYILLSLKAFEAFI